ncbi:MAG: hypothetical protein F9K37_01000 [Bacteroidales bacterium]|nr:MAG: hypothetical protein F9K37_01000 [Bacteroidales bacterium]
MTRDLKNITDKFTQIDTKIIELLQCSSDDFLGLNTDFKELFRSSSSISKNASVIFEILSESDTKVMMDELEVLYKILRKTYSPFLSTSGEGITLIKEMLEMSSNLHLQVKNLNQNLLTLKFLLANLKITGTETLEQSSPAIEELTGKYNKHINQQKLREYHNDKSLEKLQLTIDSSISRLDKYYSQLNQQINLILDQVHTAIVLFADKQQEVSRRLPSLKALTEQISESIANIITNLQYHDIIRQKIEHVQTSHRTLLQNLSDFDINNESQHLDYLSKIRDLANIQAALLVRANKEYQRAIELITEKFRAISDDMSNISNLCKDLTQSQFNQEDIHLSDLSQKLDSILVPLSGVPVIEKTLLAELTNVIESVSKTLNSVVKAESSSIDEEIAFVPLENIDKLKHAYPKGNIVDQLREVGQDVEKTSNQIQTISQRLHEVNSSLGSICNNLTEKHAEILNQTGIADRISSVLDKLKKQDEDIYKLLHDNFKISKEMDTVVAGSIKRIKYYEFFEVRIIEIIKMLNEVFQEIKGRENKKDEAEDMEFLKSLYTMESEHKIHESIIEGGENPENQNIDSEQNQDDDVELF